jgi:hypothetical protein
VPITVKMDRAPGNKDEEAKEVCHLVYPGEALAEFERLFAAHC